MKALAFSLFLAAGWVGAETPAAPEPPPGKVYQSAFEAYRPIQDEPILDWRAINDEVGRLRGHMGHLEALPSWPDGEVEHAQHGTTAAPDERAKP